MVIRDLTFLSCQLSLRNLGNLGKNQLSLRLTLHTLPIFTVVYIRTSI